MSPHSSTVLNSWRESSVRPARKVSWSLLSPPPPGPNPSRYPNACVRQRRGRMTGALDAAYSAISWARFAARVSPKYVDMPFFALLGLLVGLAYQVGAALRPREPRHSPNKRLIPHAHDGTSEALVRPAKGLAVVIPAFITTEDDRARLQACVRKLSQDAAIKDVLVVDDGSTISLRTLESCKVVRHAINYGPAAARNTGMFAAFDAGATAVAFTDADCTPAHGWAAAHLHLQEESPGIWAGATCADGTDMISRFHDAVGTLMPRAMLGNQQDALYGPTCNLSVSKDVAANIAFDPRFPTSAFEDCDFCVRARAGGYTVRISSKPVIRHRYDATVKGLVLTYHKYGRSLPIMLAKHPDYSARLAASEPTSAPTPVEYTI